MISWLDTRYDDTSGYRVYKYDASVPFAEDTSARLLKEITREGGLCLTHDYPKLPRYHNWIRSRASRSATRSCRSTTPATRHGQGRREAVQPRSRAREASTTHDFVGLVHDQRLHRDVVWGHQGFCCGRWRWAVKGIP